MLPFVAPPRGAHALLLALLNLVLLLLVVLLMSGCATRAPQVRVSPPVHESTMAPTTIADRAFVVVRAEGAAYALTEPSAAHAPSSDEARVLFRAAAIPTTFVVVGPAGQCRAESRERVVLALPSSTWTARALSDCATRISQGFALALPGSIGSVRWVEPDMGQERGLTPDPELDQDEIWQSRFDVPDADFSLYQLSFIHHVAPHHSEESVRVVVADELGKPVESYDDFSVRGLVQSDAGTWLTLLGHDDAESIRVVRLLPGEGRIALDARISVFGE